MTEDHFVRYVKHFMAHARPSKERPVFLLLKNHNLHLSIQAIQ